MTRDQPESISDEEREALVTAVETILARGLGPTAYGIYALAWRIAQLLVRLVTFGSVPALQRYLPALTEDAKRRSVVGFAYLTTLGFGGVIATTGLLVVVAVPLAGLAAGLSPTLRGTRSGTNHENIYWGGSKGFTWLPGPSRLWSRRSSTTSG